MENIHPAKICSAASSSAIVVQVHCRKHPRTTSTWPKSGWHLLGQNVIGCLILSNQMQFSPKITAEVYLLYETLTWELQAPIESLQEAALVLQGINPVKHLGIVVAW
ncbi:hypothetical protein DFH08DRAFT_820649 [Mycena albidolilacea]|uniref:Uncharacterized protein n=1 Tax=Mycena albidolilacea TaxID=1033008 RepID=A0AAD7E684_9AGAR|nr:hypothetical protein DFH08DRAFT_828521 [Mycena albidolilacea]KAJ7315394.1 hypothetical protein DFH08DRAFT_820649 [Mycena albidolilacea]